MSIAIPASVKLSEELSELFLIHDFPKLLIPASPSRHVVVALVELHAHAVNHCGSLAECRVSNVDRMLSSIADPHPNMARYFILRNNLITLLSEERLLRLPKSRPPEDVISVHGRDRMVPIVDFDWTVSGTFVWFGKKILDQVKRK